MEVARLHRPVEIDSGVFERLAAVRSGLETKIDEPEPCYGINTGFGALGRISIDRDSLQQLQENLIRSHATGVGNFLSAEIVRATMLVLCASLCRGHSGVRPVIVETLKEFLNRHVIPAVPEVGSVGASGDLAPLAHVSLALTGEGLAAIDGSAFEDAGKVLGRAGIQPVRLEAKEGLALINGTHLMCGRAAILGCDFRGLFQAALLSAAMSIDACRATPKALDPRIHELRRQEGQRLVARALLSLVDGSEIASSHQQDDPRVQDPYSFRCCPAVYGAAWDAFGYFEDALTNELGAVTDNPLIFGESRPEILSGGNFHGMPIALPLDVLAIAVSHIAGISERRVFHMLSGADPEAHLPTFMTPQAGLQSGLMITQYAAAACCNEIVTLASPASVVNFPTSASMEDYNSFGPRSAAKATRALDLARSVIAIELLCASNGIEHHRPLRSSQPVEMGLEIIRERVEPLKQDRPPAPDIARIEQLIREHRFDFVGKGIPELTDHPEKNS